MNAEQDRGIGPEKLTVRIFREVFTAEVLKSGTLKPTLEKYLRAVLENGSAKRGDKTYARKVYTDLVRLEGGNGLPDWAKKQAEVEKPLTDGDMAEMLTGISPEPERGPEALARSNTPLPVPDFVDPSEISLDDPTDVFLGGSATKDEPDPFAEPLKPILEEYVAKTTHPFVRVFTVDDVKYVAVGTFVGNIVKGENAGKKLNVNFTVNPYKTRRDIPEEILIHRGGRAVSVMHEDERECRRFLFVVKHKAGTKLRFWTRVGESDHPGGARFVILTDDGTGSKEITRAGF